MTTNGAWRTLVIDAHVALSYSEGRIKATDPDGNVQIIPLFDVRTVIVNSLQVTLTAYLMNELHKRHIGLILCNEKKQPSAEWVGYYDHHAAPARLKEQIRWKSAARRNVWSKIVRQKILMQQTMLKRLNLQSDWDKWHGYIENIEGSDRSNREGQAARLYFNALFGKSFRRRQDSPVNAALNYGYAVLCSVVTRTLTAHGYHPSLGIAHRGGTNPFNLSYDVMEPFRPWVDRIVRKHGEKPFDKELRRELVSIPELPVRYGGKKMPLLSGVDCYILDVVKTLSEPSPNTDSDVLSSNLSDNISSNKSGKPLIKEIELV